MINSSIHIFDNVGCSFSVNNGDLLIGSPLKGYRGLNSTNVGSYIPYLVRNYLTDSIEWEVGVGQIISDGLALKVKRVRVSKSSNNNNLVEFSNSSRKEFYIFANEYNFNTGFNNVIVKESDFVIDSVQATYLVDTSENIINSILPNSNDNKNLIIDIKIIGGNNPVFIKQTDGHILFTLNSSDKYARLVCSGDQWIKLNESDNQTFYQQSFDENGEANTFGMMAVNGSGIPGGSSLSLQYNNGGGFDGADAYWVNNKLLLGSDSEGSARVILPSSGNANTIFNNSAVSGDFIVQSSGDKSLFFTYDGKLGLNIPSGARPQTIFHLVNSVCQEGIRLENRSACYPANITLYHKPTAAIADNSVAGQINLSAKNSLGNKVDYVQIQSKVISYSSSSPKGEFDVIVQSPTGSTQLISANSDNIILGYNANNINVSTTGSTVGFTNSNITVNSSSINIKSPSISLQSSSVSVGSGNVGLLSVPSISTNSITSNDLYLPNISENSILSVDADGNVIAGSSLKLPNIAANKFLTTTTGGAITGTINTSDYFLSYDDISWTKYGIRTASICLRQITFTGTVPAEEFSVGDQIAVESSSQTYYRTISSIEYSNNAIVSMLVNQNLTDATVTNVSIYSITKGGYLLMQIAVDDGITSDSTSNVLSLRPLTDTVFNSQSKNINFFVFGNEATPAIAVRANAGNFSKGSGIYYSFATHQTNSDGIELTPFPIPISPSGSGISNINNTVNFNHMASGSFSGMVSSVGSNGLPSYYNTYDQNGNVAEWIQDSQSTSTASGQYVAGGSWRTVSPTGLQSIKYLVAGSGYDYVGFRVCGSDGLADSSYISSSLGLSFSTISNPSNMSDSNGLYVDTTDSQASPTYDSRGLQIESYVSSGINNLGSVNKNYRISKYEVTNSQYSLFLNAVAKTDTYGFYDSNMSGVIGGINRTGSAPNLTYSVKTNMGDKPVVFVNYLNSLRFTNWLHNGADTNTETSDGAYTITSLGNNSYAVLKNDYQKYWLPNIHEWHKAAYYAPKSSVTNTGSTVVTVKRDEPYLVSSGVYASLSVSGYLYADNIIIGSTSTASGPVSAVSFDGQDTLSLVNGVLVIHSGTNSHTLTLGQATNVSITDSESPWNGSYGNKINSDAIELSSNGTMNLISTGQMKLYSKLPVLMSGLIVDNLIVNSLKQADAQGNVVATYSNPSGGLLYKLGDDTAGTSTQFVVVDNLLTMPTGTATSPLYVNNNQQVVSFTGLSYDSLMINSSVSLKVPSIQIGEDLPFYSGSVLTHQGTGVATWEPASYLKADGMSWNRYDKRPVLIYKDKFVYTDGVSLSTLNNEMSYTDTIALVNAETRQTSYVKISDGLFIADGETPNLSTVLGTSGPNGLEITFCPNPPWAPIDCCTAVTGYAYSVNKGGYLSMELDPTATSSFNCDGGNTSLYTFKPSTANHISTRPQFHTAFNLLGEDIDFVVYGNVPTQYHRYEASLFAQNNEGIPAGLVPAFRVHSYVPNSVSGTITDGVAFSGYSNLLATIPIGYSNDTNPKITVNASSPHTISSITSGVGLLSNYADLTVSGVTYSSSILADKIFLTSSTDNYVLNAPLVVNKYGQIVSQAPAQANTVPDQPTNLSVIAGNTSVYLSWLAPENNGGSPILNYIIEYSLNRGVTWTVHDHETTTLTSIAIPNLPNDVNHIFRVKAFNIIGVGEPSSISPLIKPLDIYPSEPRNISSIRNATQINLSWLAPEFTGSNSTLTDYIIEYSSDFGLTWTSVPHTASINTSIIISGISVGPTYLIRIKAKNSSNLTGIYSQIKSSGSDVIVVEETTVDTNIWDFGIIAFTGVCI
jgi:formylglycine-generating enzyme required for sulfatase activity